MTQVDLARRAAILPKTVVATLLDVLSAWPVLGRKADQLRAAKVKMAMAVAGKYRHYQHVEIRRSHFEAAGRRCGLGDVTSVLIDGVVESTAAVIDQVTSALPDGFPESVSAPVFNGLKASARKLGSSTVTRAASRSE